MVRIGVIGYGYWGPNLVRNFHNGLHSRVTMVSDLSEDKCTRAGRTHNVKTTTNFRELIESPDVDAVVIATPVFTHFDLGMAALEAGKHVLLEKPMASTSEQCAMLKNAAEKEALVLMVDHTFLYTGAVVKLHDLISKERKLGNLRYFDSIRINLGLLQPDVNVLWDLAPHDLSILLHIHPNKPRSVQATGISHTHNGIENIAYMTVNYDEDFIAHFNCSWTSPVKIRQILIGGSEKMILFNDMEPTEKVKIYDTGFELKSEEEKRKIMVDYRVGDILTPKIDMKEALASLSVDFCRAIEDQSHKPIANADLGHTVVRLLEASQESIKNGGREVLI